MRNLDTKYASIVREVIDDEENIWDIEGMVTAKDIACIVFAASRACCSAFVRMGARLCLGQSSKKSSWLVRALT